MPAYQAGPGCWAVASRVKERMPMSSPAPRRMLLLAWLTGSESGRLVLEILAAVFLIGEAGILLWFSTTLAVGWQVLLWVQWAALLAGLRRLGLFQLFGPVFVFDLVRASRRRRHV